MDILTVLAKLADDIDAGNWFGVLQTIVGLANEYIQEPAAVRAAAPGQDVSLDDASVAGYLRTVTAPDNRMGIGSSVLSIVLPILLRWAANKFFGK